jgi:hypothetical protein
MIFPRGLEVFPVGEMISPQGKMFSPIGRETKPLYFALLQTGFVSVQDTFLANGTKTPGCWHDAQVFAIFSNHRTNMPRVSRLWWLLNLPRSSTV